VPGADAKSDRGLKDFCAHGIGSRASSRAALARGRAASAGAVKGAPLPRALQA